MMSETTQRFVARREAILAAAAAEFNHEGIRGATLARVAARVGLLKASLNYYYRRKEDLAAECMLQAITVFRSAVSAAGTGNTPAERIRAFILARARIEAEIAHGSRAVLVSFNEIRALGPPFAERVAVAYGTLFREVRDLLPATRSRSLRQRRSAHAHLLLALANAMPELLARYEPDDYPSAAQQLADMVLFGLWRDEPAAQAIVSQALAAPRPTEAPGTVGRVDTAESAVPAALLRAATALVNDHGFRGASIERIAAQLELTKGAFYHHLESKEALVSLCFERSFEVIRRAQRDAQAQYPTGARRLADTVIALVRFQLSAQGPLLRSSARSVLPPEPRRELVERHARLTQRFAVFVLDGMKESVLRPVDASLAARYVAAMIDAAASLRRWAPGIGIEDAPAVFAAPVLLGLERCLATHDDGAAKPVVASSAATKHRATKPVAALSRP